MFIWQQIAEVYDLSFIINEVNTMIKAIFLDFYGTVVHEDGEIIKRISNGIFNTGKVEKISDIDHYWWETFYDLFSNSYGNSFRTQRELEQISLKKTIQHFKSTANYESLSQQMFDYWVAPPIFCDSTLFLEKCPVPICIVTNIDTNDIKQALKFHNLEPRFIVTSENAKSYKPRPEIFEMALEKVNLSPNEVLHIGDSISSDIKGAKPLGINTLWLNRNRKQVPTDIKCENKDLISILSTSIFS